MTCRYSALLFCSFSLFPFYHREYAAAVILAIHPVFPGRFMRVPEANSKIFVIEIKTRPFGEIFAKFRERVVILIRAS